MSEVIRYTYSNKNGRNNCKPKRRLTEEELQKLAINKKDGKKINIVINDEIIAIYKANIYKYESGKIDVIYECDKDNNTECNKRNCRAEYCTHALNKKYAKNFMDNH